MNNQNIIFNYNKSHMLIHQILQLNLNTYNNIYKLIKILN